MLCPEMKSFVNPEKSLKSRNAYLEDQRADADGIPTQNRPVQRRVVVSVVE